MVFIGHDRVLGWLKHALEDLDNLVEMGRKMDSSSNKPQ